MQTLQGIKVALDTTNPQRAVGGVSGTVDCRDYQRARIVLSKFARSGQGGKVIFRVRHATSTLTYANATAFSSAAILSTATASTGASIAFDIDMAGVGPYLRWVASSVTASTSYTVFAELTRGVANPTVGRDLVATSGFTTVRTVPVSP